MRRWGEDLEKCWRRQVWEVTSWKGEREQAGAVVWETRDLGTGFTSWHALLIEASVIVHMKVLNTPDAKKMMRHQTKEVAGKRWATKHECEQLKDGVCFLAESNCIHITTVLCDRTSFYLEKKKSGQILRALPKRTTHLDQAWSCVEGGWTQKKSHDIGWADTIMCKGCDEEEGTGMHRLYHCHSWKEVRNEILEELRKGSGRLWPIQFWPIHFGPVHLANPFLANPLVVSG